MIFYCQFTLFDGTNGSMEFHAPYILFCLSVSPAYVSIFLFNIFIAHQNIIKNLFKAQWNEIILVKKLNETTHIVPWYFSKTYVIPWNSMGLRNINHSPKEFHGISVRTKNPWNSIEFFIFPSSIEFHETFVFQKKVPWISNLINLIIEEVMFLNIVLGIMMIMCYLAKFSQEHYMLHWFQYHKTYFRHPIVRL